MVLAGGALPQARPGSEGGLATHECQSPRRARQRRHCCDLMQNSIKCVAASAACWQQSSWQPKSSCTTVGTSSLQLPSGVDHNSGVRDETAAIVRRCNAATLWISCRSRNQRPMPSTTLLYETVNGVVTSRRLPRKAWPPSPGHSAPVAMFRSRRFPRQTSFAQESSLSLSKRLKTCSVSCIHCGSSFGTLSHQQCFARSIPATPTWCGRCARCENGFCS